MKRPRKRHPKTGRKEQKDAFFSPALEVPTNDSGFFQPKLEIDPIDSPSEKEADAVANQVVNRPQQKNTDNASIQRKTLDSGDELFVITKK